MYIVVHTRVMSRDLLSESTTSKVKKRYNSNNSSLFVYYSSDDIKWEDICPYIKPNTQLLQGATTEGRDEVVKISKCRNSCSHSANSDWSGIEIGRCN